MSGAEGESQAGQRVLGGAERSLSGWWRWPRRLSCLIFVRLVPHPRPHSRKGNPWRVVGTSLQKVPECSLHMPLGTMSLLPALPSEGPVPLSPSRCFKCRELLLILQRPLSNVPPKGQSSCCPLPLIHYGGVPHAPCHSSPHTGAPGCKGERRLSYADPQHQGLPIHGK